jgi:hypothetical protein
MSITEKHSQIGAEGAMPGNEPEQDISPVGSARELERIKVLRQYAVLDTEPEQEFDDLAAMAAHICGTPIALISLVDADRQWFKSKIGLSVNQTPRSQSICAHALDRPDDVFIVPDASHDNRFSQNPLVTGEPGIRFYAGAPLITPDDVVLGTICVIDRVPRELTSTQEWMLQTLAQQVMRKLESRLVSSQIEPMEVLREGVHDLNLEQLQKVVCTTPSRWSLWLRLLSFLTRPILDQQFSFAYIGGTVLSNRVQPEDVKVILETKEPFSSCGFTPLKSYIRDGQERIRQVFSVHLHFWIQDKPHNQLDHELFFSPRHPLIELGSSGETVVCVNLRNPKIFYQLRAVLDPFKDLNSK